jgi:hypothetical protein
LKTDFVRCEECDFPIGIEIGYGETLPPKGMFRTNGEFIKLVSDESKAKILSKELLSSRVLPDASLIVKRVGVSELGGLNVLQAQSNFKSKGQVIWLNAAAFIKIAEAIVSQRKRIKQNTIALRRKNHYDRQQTHNLMS